MRIAYSIVPKAYKSNKQDFLAPINPHFVGRYHYCKQFSVLSGSPIHLRFLMLH